ncbi:MAG TPA: twin-arginine translocase subunit TatC [Verrucomicrobiae bacterium]|jgi:sec-independent protein translocase protein TatC
MANQADEERPEFEEGEGGPVKSFLEHLEDFRWMLIKCCAALGVAMLVCLIGGNWIITVLKWPLEHPGIFRTRMFLPQPPQMVTFRLGTNELGNFAVGTNQLGALALGTNHHVVLQFETVELGGNQVVALRAATNAPPLPRKPLVDLINLSPAEAFFLAFKVAIYAGILLSSPFLFYFIGEFVLPALKIKEKKYLLRGFVTGLGLFLIGVSFCYLVLMPVALRASMQYSQWLGFTATQWRAGDYIGFVCKFMLGMGLGFELPVVILVLVKIGILSYRMLAGFRRYMIVINLILGAVLTTPEVITQVLMFVPLQLLYEMTIWIAWYWERNEKKRKEAAGAD